MWIVEELIKVKVDVNLRDNLNIFFIIVFENGYLCIVEILWKVGVEVILNYKCFKLLIFVC